jgi:uncharacterized HAD superfamily protein
MVKKGAPSLATQLAVSGALISSALLAMELRFYMEDQELDEWRAGSAGVCLLVCIVVYISTVGLPGWGKAKPVLAVDLDECCCGYVPAFLKFMNAEYGTSLVLKDFTSYMFWEVPKCKVTREESTDRVEEFHKSKYFDQIETLPGAKAALDQLKESFELHVVTSRQADIEQKTRDFVEKHFPDTFTGMHFGNHFGRSGAKVSKPDMCAKIGAVALIDDSLKYAQECAAAGIPVLLFGDYMWNRSADEPLHEGVTRGTGWSAVTQILTSDKSKGD